MKSIIKETLYGKIKIENKWKHKIKENKSMKGIKIGIVGVCVSLFGIALALNNFFAICIGVLGLLLAIIGCVIKDK